MQGRVAQGLGTWQEPWNAQEAETGQVAGLGARSGGGGQEWRLPLRLHLHLQASAHSE